MKVVELFAGVGAWTMTLKRIGVEHEVVLAVDYDEYTVAAYNAIHETNYMPVDMTLISPETVPDCNLICYSPPCVTFSSQGRQEGFQDERGLLFFDALRIIREKQPEFAIMENVEDLTKKKFEFEYKTMISSLENAGYRNYPITLNARYFGTPQNRKRVFIISIRNDLDIEFEEPEQIEYQFTLNNALNSDVMTPLLHNIYGGFKEKKARVFPEYSPTLKAATGGGNFPSAIVRSREYIDNYKIVHFIDGNYYLDQQHSYKYGDILEQNDYMIRQITPLEAFRIMGFSDADFEKAKKSLNDTFYKGKDKSASKLLKMAGNSIPLSVIECIFRSLFSKDKNKIFDIIDSAYYTTGNNKFEEVF